MAIKPSQTADAVRIKATEQTPAAVKMLRKLVSST